jgi:Cof subfamily protein (haloacid dehalogenase superfamily)
VSIRLIAIDIDGTLTPSLGPPISPRNAAAVRAAEAAGIEVVIATGRRQAYAMPLVEQMGLGPASVMISSNGAVIRSFGGELIGRTFLSRESARKLCGELREWGTLVFTFDRPGRGGLVVEDLFQVRSRIERWVDANRAYLTEVRPIETAFDGAELPIQGMVCGTVEEMRQADAELRACGMDGEVALHRTEYEARNLCILDLLAPGCSKGVALAKLAGLRGLTPGEVMAIGDNLNDLEMLEYAGRPVVMGNAGQELLAVGRDRGWELTETNDGDGVACAIESVLAASSEISGRVRQPEGEMVGATAHTPQAYPEDHDGNLGRVKRKDTISGCAR